MRLYLSSWLCTILKSSLFVIVLFHRSNFKFLQETSCHFLDLIKTKTFGHIDITTSRHRRRRCRLGNITVITATRSFKTLKSLENAIFRANLISELGLFGTALPQILIHKSPILRLRVSAIASLPRTFAHSETHVDTFTPAQDSPIIHNLMLNSLTNTSKGIL